VRVVAVTFVLLVLGMAMSPSVLGAETREVYGSLRLEADADFDANFTFNLSDPANSYLMNWNQTVEGFQDNASLDGAFTGPFLPPLEMLVKTNLNDVETLTACGVTRFKKEWVMSGSTESWWRVPWRGPYYGDTVNLTLWRVGSPDQLNFTTDTPNSASHPTKVFDHSYDLDVDELNLTFRWYNTTAWNHTFNSTWVRVAAPVHGDEFYAFKWEVTNDTTYAEHWLRFAQNDVADDRIFTTWVFYPNETYDYLEADLDVSVLHVVGHGYGMWGREFEDDDNITFRKALEEDIENGDYLTVMVPFLEMVDNSTNVWVSVNVVESGYSAAFLVAENGPTDFGLHSWLYDLPASGSTVQVTIRIQNRTRTLWVLDPNTKEDPDVTWELSRHVVENHAWAPDDYYFGGVPYASVQVTNGSWVNALPPPVYILGGRVVGLESVVKRSQDSPDWWVQYYLDGYEGMVRVWLAIKFTIRGDYANASNILDPDAPFPTDVGWFPGRYFFQAAFALADFGGQVWSALVWVYNGIVWIVKNAPWVIAGTLKILTLFITLPIWARYFILIGGLIKFGWTMARKGLIEAAEFADEFWTNYIATSYAKKAVGLVRRAV